MERAWILGRPAALDAAVAEAGKLIAASTRILLAGLVPMSPVRAPQSRWRSGREQSWII